MRQTAGLVLFFIFLSIIFVEPVRDSLNDWFRRNEISEERALGTAIPYKQHIKDIQIALARSGFAPGFPDGNLGDETRRAVRLFQESRGLRPTGWINRETLEAIEKEGQLHKELAHKETNRQIHAQFAVRQETAVRETPVPPLQPQGLNWRNESAPVSAVTEPEPVPVPAAEVRKEEKPEQKHEKKEGAAVGKKKPAYDPKQIQTALRKAGLYKGTVDGKIGKQTRRAIKAFQKKHRLKIDGVVGEKTWTLLKKHL